MSEKKGKSALSRLRAKDKKFVEGITAGMSAIEAAKYAGSKAATRAGLAAHASRWKSRDAIQAAIRELRELHAVDDEALWGLVRKALRELLQDRSNPGARARACELMARLLGKLQPERHEHVHAHLDIPDPESETGRAELVRLIRIVLQAMDPVERATLIQEALQGVKLVAAEAS